MNKDLAASVRARLLTVAKAAGVDFNQVLVRYALERLLYRLSQSAYADRFLLKGALLFTLWYDMPHRPTRDADLLGFGPSDLESIGQTFRDIASVTVEDGILFDPASVSDALGHVLRLHPIGRCDVHKDIVRLRVESVAFVSWARACCRTCCNRSRVGSTHGAFVRATSRTLPSCIHIDTLLPCSRFSKPKPLPNGWPNYITSGQRCESLPGCGWRSLVTWAM